MTRDRSGHRHIVFPPGEWGGLPLTGWWAVSDGAEIIALFKVREGAGAWVVSKDAVARRGPGSSRKTLKAEFGRCANRRSQSQYYLRPCSASVAQTLHLGSRTCRSW